MTRAAYGTVVRTAPVDDSGVLGVVDVATGRVDVRHDALPADRIVPPDPNPRGGARGWRGIVRCADGLVVADDANLHVLDDGLRIVRTIGNPLLAGVHELCDGGDATVWVASTRIDGLVRTSLTDGAVVDERWPRDQVGIAAALGVEPGALDRSLDHRTVPVELHPGPSHLHLNAVARIDGRLHALSNAFGAVLDVDGDEVVVRSDALRGAHDLLLLRDGTVGIVATGVRELHRYDPADRWRCVQRIDLTAGAGSRIWWEARLRERSWAANRRFGRVPRHAPRPFFARGLAELADGTLLVGTSPAAVLRVDAEGGDVVGAVRLGGDNHHCVHGLVALG